MATAWSNLKPLLVPPGFRDSNQIHPKIRRIILHLRSYSHLTEKLLDIVLV